MNGQMTPAAAPAWGPMKHVKRVFIALAGGTVLAIGITLIVLPGPAFLVIPAGLAILGIEFAWAKRWLRRGREMLPERLKEVKMQTIRQHAGLLLRRVQRFILLKKA